MISQLFEILKSIGASVFPVAVIDAWQKGVVLRFGKPHRVLSPGFYFVIPFVEHVIRPSVVTTTTTLSAQTLLAPDGKLYTVEGVVRWSVSDVEAFAVKIWDGGNVVVDCCKGAIARALRELGADEIDSRILKYARAALDRYGIKVEAVTLTTIATVRVFRIISNQLPEPQVAES